MVQEFFPLLLSILLTIVVIISIIALVYILLTGRSKSLDVYYPPKLTAGDLAEKLLCPNCGKTGLRPLSKYALKCDACGFTFSLGVLRTKEERFS